MALNLPQPDTARLERSPLELVVCQIRHERKPAVADPQVPIALHEALGGSEGPYSTLDEATSSDVSMTMTPQGPTLSESKSTGWQFTGPDSAWAVTFFPDHFALQTTAYTTWDDFRQRLQTLVNAATAHVAPALMRRCGLRYVDRISELGLTSVDAWQPYLSASVLGLAADPRFANAVTNVQSRYELLLDNGVAAIFSAQPVYGHPDGTLPYQLDYDIYRGQGQPFDPAKVMETADELNIHALQLFQATVTDELLERLR